MRARHRDAPRGWLKGRPRRPRSRSKGIGHAWPPPARACNSLGRAQGPDVARRTDADVPALDGPLPRSVLPLHVFEPRYRALVADCLAGSGEFGIVLIARGSEVGGGDERVGVGTVARIGDASPLSDGRWVPGRARDPADPGDAVAARRPLPGGHGGRGRAGAPASPPDDALLAAAVFAVRRARALLSEAGRGRRCRRTSASSATPNWRPGRSAGWLRSAPSTSSGCSRPTIADARLAEVAELSAAVADDVAAAPGRRTVNTLWERGRSDYVPGQAGRRAGRAPPSSRPRSRSRRSRTRPGATRAPRPSRRACRAGPAGRGPRRPGRCRRRAPWRR